MEQWNNWAFETPFCFFLPWRDAVVLAAHGLRPVEHGKGRHHHLRVLHIQSDILLGSVFRNPCNILALELEIDIILGPAFRIKY
jgi:hypothetical protein